MTSWDFEPIPGCDLAAQKRYLAHNESDLDLNLISQKEVLSL